MASFSERRARRLAEQEGQVDAPAIDSDIELGISHSPMVDLEVAHDINPETNYIAEARERAMGSDYVPYDRQAIADEYGIDFDDIPDVAEGIVETTTQVKDYARGVQLSYRQASLGMEKGRIGSRMKAGTATAADAKRLEEINKETSELQKEVEGKPFVATSFGTLAPYLLNSAREGGEGALWGAMIGGTLGGVAGNFIPGFQFLPEEAITVPGGAAFGAKIGSMWKATKDISDIEGGTAFLEFTEMGMDDNKAAIASDIIGLGSGLLEMAQFKMLKRLLPGKDALVNSAVAKAAQKVLSNNIAGRAATKAVGVAVPEAGVETLQEFWGNVVSIAATEIQPELDKTDLGPEGAKEYFDRLTEGLVETFATTVVGFGVAAIPGVGVDVATSRGKSLKSEETSPGVNLVTNQEDNDVDVTDVEQVQDVRPTVSRLLGVEEDTTEEGMSISNG